MKALVFDGLDALAGRVDRATGVGCDVAIRKIPVLECPSTPPRCQVVDYDVALEFTNTCPLATVSTHKYDGIVYEAHETPDGFSAIRAISGGSDVFESNGRLSSRFIVNGAVRMYSGLWDNNLQKTCIPMLLGNGLDPTQTPAMRCVPEDHAYVGMATSAGQCPYEGPFVEYTNMPATTVSRGFVVRCDELRLVGIGHPASCYHFEKYVCHYVSSDVFGALPPIVTDD